MTDAKMCKCGHSKSSHQHKQKNNKIWKGKCDDYYCDCKKFKFKEMKDIISYPKTIVDENQGLPSAIYEPLPLEPRKTKDLLISECDVNGKARYDIIKCKICKKSMHHNSFKTHMRYCKLQDLK